MIVGRKRRERQHAAAVRRGRKMVMEDDHEGLYPFAKDAVDRFPEDPELRLMLASASLTSEPDAVASQAAKAAQLGVDDPAIQVRAGHFLLTRPDGVGAKACAERARELAGPDFPLLAGLETLEATLLAIDGEHDAAEKLFRSAVDREPRHPTYAVSLARFLENRGRTPEALSVLDQASERIGEQADLLYMRNLIERDITSSTVFVKLLGEAVDVWRPVRAEHISGDLYRIADQEYDRDDEVWQFEPGSLVICGFADLADGPTLVAQAESPALDD